MNEPTHSEMEVLEALDAAWETVSALCSGRMRWTMSVPAEPDRDPDLVIGHALTLAKQYVNASRDPLGLLKEPEAANR